MEWRRWFVVLVLGVTLGIDLGGCCPADLCTEVSHEDDDFYDDDFSECGFMEDTCDDSCSSGDCCVDLATDNQHCGVCGNACEIGVCDNGVCEQSTTDLGGGAVHSIALGSDHVFYADRLGIHRVHKRDLTRESLPDTEGAERLFVHDDVLHYVNITQGCQIWAWSPSVHEVIHHEPDSYCGAVAVDDDGVYFAHRDELWSIVGGVATMLYENLDADSWDATIALDDTHIYFGWAHSVPLVLSKSGGAPSPLIARPLAQRAWIITAGERVIWNTDKGRIVFENRVSGERTILDACPHPLGCNPGRITSHADLVFWTADDGADERWLAGASTSGTPRETFRSREDIRALIADDTHVYLGTDFGVLRVAHF